MKFLENLKTTLSFKSTWFYLELENIGYFFIFNKSKNKLFISPIILKAQIGRQYLEITEFCVYFFRRIWLTKNTANYFKHRRRFSISKKLCSHLSFVRPNGKENFVIHFIGSFSIHYIGSFFNSFYWQFFNSF